LALYKKKIKKGDVMGIFDKLNGPVFLKESSDAFEQLEQLNRLHQNAAGSLKKQIVKVRNW
jgi:hypothetical protein